MRAPNLAVMVRPVDGAAELTDFLCDRRFNAMAIGPGLGVNDATCELVLAALDGERAVVLDADAITSFAGEPRRLAEALKNAAATGHACSRRTRVSSSVISVLWTSGLRPDRSSKGRGSRPRSTGAIVLIKGADTVVAAPDGRASIAGNAPAFLATAGAGDVLTGITAGLLAQGMPAFEAASAAVWLHGEAAALFGPGLIAEDLPETLPRVYRALLG